MPFKIVRNDITRVAADAIVNTANPEPKFGSGTDAAVYRAAGTEELLAARKKIGRISPGECAVTPAFSLPAKYIIHTVGPAWTEGEHGEFEILRSCYRKSLLLAEHLGCGSIAFPLIATGVYGFPKDKALDTALDVIREHLEDSDLDVTLVVFNPGAFRIAQGLADKVEAYIDEKYVAAQTAKEYGVKNERDAAITAERREAERRRRLYDAPAGASMAQLSAAAMPAAAYQPMADASAALAPVMSQAPGAKKPAPSAKPAQAKKQSLDEAVKHLGESFQARLLRMIDERDLKDSQVYHSANLSRQVFSKIRCSEDYIPTKKTVLALAIGLKLGPDDTRDLLAAAGYALTDNSTVDIIVSFCIDSGVYDMFEVNRLLFRYTQTYLGSTME